MKRRSRTRRLHKIATSTVAVQLLENRALLTSLANGQEVFGTVAVGDSQEFEFDASVGETILFSVGETAGNSFVAEPFIELFDPNGDSVDSNFGNSSSNESALQFVAELSGEYTAVVRDVGLDESLEYRARVAVLPGSESPNLISDRDKALSNGEEVLSSVPIGGFNLFEFDVTDGESVLFSVGETEGNGLIAQPYVQVFDASGALVDSDFGNLSSNEAAVQFSAVGSGTYTATVQDLGIDAEMFFRARVVVLPGSESPNLISDRDKALSNGEEVLSSVPIGGFNLFEFDVTDGESVLFSVGETEGNGLIAQPYVQVFDASGALVDSDFGNLSSNEAAVQFSAVGSGTYTATVQDLGIDAEMFFRARVVVLPGSESPNLISDRDKALSNGEEVLSSVPIGGFNLFEFDVTDGESVLFSVGETEGNGLIAQPYVQVFDASGALVDSDFGNLSSNEAAVQFSAVGSGTYTATVQDLGIDAEMFFRARVVVLPGSESPNLISDRDKALSNGEEVLSSVPIGGFNLFEFDVTDGESVLFSVGETEGNGLIAQPYVQVFDASGALVDSDFGNLSSNEAAVQFSAVGSGTYTATVQDLGIDAEMFFRARVVVLPGSESPNLISDRDKALSNGEEVLSSVPIGGFNLFEFDVTDGESVLFSVGETEGNGLIAQPYVQVFDASGALVDSDFGNLSSNEAAVQFSAVGSGTYTATVQDLGIDAEMFFRARVVVLPGGESPNLISDRDKPLSNGELFESSTPIGGFSVFPFAAGEGEKVRFEVDETDANGFIAQPLVEIFGPDGASIGVDFGNSSSNNAFLEFNATETGGYNAIVRDAGLDHSLAFVAKLEKGEVFINSQVLNISGTINADDVLIDQGGAETVVTMDTREWTFSNSAFDSINIELFSGDDDLSVVNVNRPMTVSGGDGNDTIQTGSANDEIQGDAGDDSIIGSDGDDTIGGGIGNDTIRGNDGNDDIEAGEGNDSVIGGGGDDSIVGGDGADTLGGSVGDDTVLGGFDDDELGGGSGNDSVLGDEGHDSITGEEGDDTIFGGSGNDSIFAASGNDSLDGGAGNDSVFGGGNADTLTGSGGNDTLFGRGGKDIVFGNGGDDSIVGGGGTDTLHGNSGADTLKGGRFADAIIGGPGDDSLNGGDQRDLLIGGDGLDTLNGNGQNDILVEGLVSWEEDNSRLADVMAEWDSTRTFAERVANLRDGSGTSPANGTTFLSDDTVSDDNFVDQLNGEGAKDWFFASLDEILDLTDSDVVD